MKPWQPRPVAQRYSRDKPAVPADFDRDLRLY